MSTPTRPDRRDRGRIASGVDSVRRRLRRGVASLYFSDWFVILLTLAAAGVAADSLAGALGGGLALVAGLTAALAIVTTNSRNPLLTALGAVPVAVGGLVGIVLLGYVALLAVRSPATGIVGGAALLCLAVAGLGAFLTPFRNVSATAISRSILVSVLIGAGVFAVLALRVLPAADLRRQFAAAAVGLVAAVAGAATSGSSQFGLPTFLLTVGVAAWAVRAGLARLPLERWLPADRRDAASAVLGRVRRALGWLFRIGVVGALVTGGLAVAGGAPASYVRVDGLASTLPAPAGGVVAALLLSQPLRVGLVALALAGLGVVVATKLSRLLRRGIGWLAARVVGPVAGGAAAGLVFGTALRDDTLPRLLATALPESAPSSLVGFVSSIPPFAAATVLLLVGVGAFTVALLALLSLRAKFALPTRAGSAALASLGLFGVATTAVLVGRNGLGLGVVVAALAVWDVGEFRTGLREDLPATASTLRIEAVHATASVVVAAVVGVLAWLLFAGVVPLVSPPRTRIAAAGILVVTAVAVLLALQIRG